MARKPEPATTGSVRMGPISIFTLVIVICLAVMATLALTTARADTALAERQASFTADDYANECLGQAFLAEVDAALASARAVSSGRSFTRTVSGSAIIEMLCVKIWLTVHRAWLSTFAHFTGWLGCTTSAPVRDISAYAASGPEVCPWQARNMASSPIPSLNALTHSSKGLGQEGSLKRARTSGRSYICAQYPGFVRLTTREWRV